MEVVFLLKLIHTSLSKYWNLSYMGSVHYMACNKYYLISFSCTKLLYKNFNFSYSWALQKWLVFMRNIIKKFWLKFRTYAKFREKNIYFDWMHNFVKKNWFRNDTKIMRNFVISCKTTKLLRKRIDCFVETLIRIGETVILSQNHVFLHYTLQTSENMIWRELILAYLPL